MRLDHSPKALPARANNNGVPATRLPVEVCPQAIGWFRSAAVAAVLALGGGVVGATPPASEPAVALSAPGIRFANPVFDFGRVESGQPVQHNYWFTNTGQQALEIRDVRPSCGCTLAANWDRLVQPGKAGSIPVHLNYGAFAGDLHKTVIVVCNDPLQTNAVLQIKGTIWKPIEITPAYLVFTPAPDSVEPDTRLVRILNNTDEPLTLSAPELTNRSFQATLKPLKPGKEFELKVAFLPPFKPGTVTTPISLKTSRPTTPAITLSACGLVQAAVTALPAQVTLPPGPLAAPVTLTVTLQNHGTNALVLSEPGVSADGADAHVHEVEPGRTFQLALSFPEGFQIPAGEKIEARVKTSNALLPVLRIPVSQGRSLSAALNAGRLATQAADTPATGNAN